ncbi:DUF2314 domain-containing protein [Pseudarthrobacter sp. Y6]|uniref:DUF2314 domain-containing protein n=1 Tax=Pseudarthrobacter sp. Y6 TaxID=3418422 RepID=UPI003CE8F9A1
MNATLIDGCQRNHENPDSFPIPEPEAKELIRPGSYVKLMFATPSCAERMWVLTTARNGPKLKGTLSNEPFLLSDELALGDHVTFTLDNVIDIQN